MSPPKHLLYKQPKVASILMSPPAAKSSLCVGIMAGSQIGMDPKGGQSTAGSGKATAWEMKRCQIFSESPTYVQELCACGMAYSISK